MKGPPSFHSGVTAFAFRASKRRLEARGVEPLSSSLSAQTSTRLSGENSEEPSHAPAHCQLPSVHEIDSRTGAVAPPIRQPAVHVFAVSRRHCENVAVN